MTTPTADLDARRLVPQAPLNRPTPQQIDAMVADYENAEACLEAQKKVRDSYKLLLVNLAQRFGEVPAGAEKSIRLAGQITKVTVTSGSTIALKDSAVATLGAAMEANGWQQLFRSMFRTRTEYDLIKGAENVFRVAELPQRLAAKFSMMFAACFDVKAKSPSLKITRLADKPTKKPRAKKAVA